MKIHWDMTGKELAEPDFAMLRAGLRAAQAATRTAEASDHTHVQPSLTEALTLLFGDNVPAGREAATLHGSFNPASVRNDFDERER